MNRVKSYMMAAWMMGVFFAVWVDTASATISRTIERVSEVRVAVRLDWSFAAEPQSGLIVEEAIPEGWLLQGADCGGMVPHIREEALSVAMATGIEAPLASSGSLTYWLHNPSVQTGDELHFDGTAYVIQGTEPVSLAVSGTSFFRIDTLEWEEKRLRLTEWSSASVDGEAGVSLSFVVDSTPVRAFGSEGEDGAAPANTIRVEYRSTLRGDEGWQCIHTSAPASRVDHPGSIYLPVEPDPGFYRLRLESE